ncbi:MAG: hypothetical protein ABSE86_21230 [Bryobacteraceae bacterium]
MKVRFLADADLNKIIVTGTLRREPSVDFLTAHMAAGQQRLLVSHDVGTMPAHFRACKAAGKHSAGLLLLPQSLDVGTAIDELLLIWLASEASEWESQMVWLPL